MKHTPGPWEVDGNDNDLEIRPVSLDEDVSVIAVLPLESYADLEDWDECGGSATMEANANLIAAAPEMAELLEEAIQAIWEKGKYIFTSEKTELTDHIKGLLRRIEGEEDAE